MTTLCNESTGRKELNLTGNFGEKGPAGKKYIHPLIISLFAGIFAIFTWFVWIFNPSILDQLPGWFWQIGLQPLKITLPVMVILLFALTMFRIALKGQLRVKTIILMMIALASAQYFLAGLEGRGIAALKERLIHTGHARLARSVLTMDAATLFSGRWDEEIESNRLTIYAITKPPGYLIPYWILGRAARIKSGKNLTLIYEKMTLYSSLLFPLISSLVLLPLYLIGKRCLDLKGLKFSLLIPALLPSLQLITLHVDQFLLPCIFGMWLYFMDSAWTGKNLKMIFLAGILLWLALYFSFSFIYLAFLPLLWIDFSKDYLKKVIFWLLGLFTATAGGLLLLKYNPVINFRNATSLHNLWSAMKLEKSPPSDLFFVGFTNLLEFLIWLGPSVAVLFLVSLFRKETPFARYRSFLVLCLILGAFFSGTAGESARLWLYLTPIVILFASRELSLIAVKSPSAVRFLILFQVLSLVLQKGYMDFM